MNFKERENQQFKEELEESKRRFKNLVDSLPLTVAETDREGNITFNNANSLVTFGYTKEDLAEGLNVLQMIAPENHERTKNTFQMLLKGQKAKKEEYTGLRKDGSKFPLRVYMTPILNKNECVGFIIILIDITERKISEETLQVSQLQLMDGMELAQIVYWENDPVTEEFIFNDPFYTFYGTTVEQEGGYRMPREEYAKRFIHPDDLPIFLQFVEQNSRRTDHEFVADNEHRVVRRDGQVRYILARTRIARDNSGRIVKRYGANQDITERKLAEDKREELISELQKALVEVKNLSGLLPICASCKKIRNDTGYWEQVEEYIRAHSEATFSHSLCPECAEKLYPELFRKS